MSVINEISRIKNSKEKIKNTINQDFSIVGEEKIDEYSNLIDMIIENYKSYIPSKKISGNNITVNDVVPIRTKEISIEGNSEQETTTGKNLFDISDIAVLTSGVTIDNDGWITVSKDNTSGTDNSYLNIFTHNLNLKEDTNYNVFFETKNISGDKAGRLYVTSIFYSDPCIGQFNSSWEIPLKNLSDGAIVNNILKTVTNFNMCGDEGLRTFVSINPGEKISITFRISVIEDTTVTPNNFSYEQYTGGLASPSPDYPQKIDVVKGENLLPNNATSQTINGITYIVNEDGSIYVKGTATARSEFNICTNHFTLEANTLYKMQTDILTILSTSDGFISGSKGITFSKDSEIRVWKAYIRVEIGESIDKIIYPMITLASVIDDTYVPYQNIRVKVTGKNLYNYEDVIQSGLTGVSGETGWITLEYDNTEGIDTKFVNYFTHNLDLLPSTYYKIVVEIKEVNGSGLFSIVSNHSTKQGQIEDASNYEKNIGNYENGDILILDAKTFNNCDERIYGLRTYCLFNVGQSGSITFRISVLENTPIIPETFSYEPYKSKNYLIDLKGNFLGKIDDVKDTLTIDKNGHLLLNKKISKFFLDGDDWYRSSYSNATIFSVYNDVLMQNYKTGKIICSNLSYVPNVNHNTIVEYCSRDGISLRIGINKSRLLTQDISGFKNWLSNNNIIAYAELITPEIIDLGYLSEMIELYDGVNNIKLMSYLKTDLEIEYYSKEAN